jgi:hypothetical protein
MRAFGFPMGDVPFRQRPVCMASGFTACVERSGCPHSLTAIALLFSNGVAVQCGHRSTFDRRIGSLYWSSNVSKGIPTSHPMMGCSMTRAFLMRSNAREAETRGLHSQGDSESTPNPSVPAVAFFSSCCVLLLPCLPQRCTKQEKQKRADCIRKAAQNPPRISPFQTRLRGGAAWRCPRFGTPRILVAKPASSVPSSLPITLSLFYQLFGKSDPSFYGLWPNPFARPKGPSRAQRPHTPRSRTLALCQIPSTY